LSESAYVTYRRLARHTTARSAEKHDNNGPDQDTAIHAAKYKVERVALLDAEPAGGTVMMVMMVRGFLSSSYGEMKNTCC
jgi:hypothetical protein